jgi:hypothetical protein
MSRLATLLGVSLLLSTSSTARPSGKMGGRLIVRWNNAALQGLRDAKLGRAYGRPGNGPGAHLYV